MSRLLIPSCFFTAYFETVIRACYNLHVVQILARLSLGLSKREREALKESFTQSPLSQAFACHLGQVIHIMENGGLYKEDDVAEAANEDTELEGLDVDELDSCAQELALPFLRIATLIVHYFFERPLPKPEREEEEFAALVRFLGLSGEAEDDDSRMDHGQAGQQLSVCDGLEWFNPKSSTANELTVWCREYFPLVDRRPTMAKHLLLVNLLWKQPKLLNVPREYDTIFQFYHERKCNKCGRVPKDPTVCLMCGTMVCLKEQCCKNVNSLEGGN